MNHAFGRPNLGVDALSRSNIAILRSACMAAGIKPTFVLFGKPGTDAPTDSDVTQGPFLRLRQLVTGRFGEFRQAIANCDLVVDICAGDGFTDIYGTKLFMVHNLGKWATLVTRRPLVFAPQTIGPFNSTWSRAIARNIFNHATLTFARDGLSMKTLKEMKITSPCQEVIDVAFRLPFEAAPPRAPDAPVRVGINVSGLLFRHGERFQLTLDYPALMRAMIENVLSRPNHEVCLVSHVIHDDESSQDDYDAACALAKEYPGVQLSPKFRNSEEAKSYISGLDFFTGGRMHACIGAISSGVPVLPIAYSRKFNGLFETLGYPHMIDGRAIDTAEAMAKFDAALDQREAMAKACQAGLGVARQRLQSYEAAMQELLSRIAAASNRHT
ncbi:polysaccharide pyruvyl transferase family protein [Novosphingobium sp. 1949]|uniref:Polysaccharide pyruvyl transferase family protein n=1 Tax=Novosphingobium organovorum TaxID=2930092 RepID=A0ABT0BDL1_9SPHN|nr:polysaccharide pyruvyl transferase family protein [Novosphingobium organovorum]MCJ2183122.1 polysaccharide pyruvyl transferase family protein [Novosphingobium organovorum]